MSDHEMQAGTQPNSQGEAPEGQTIKDEVKNEQQLRSSSQMQNDSEMPVRRGGHNIEDSEQRETTKQEVQPNQSDDEMIPVQNSNAAPAVQKSAVADLVENFIRCEIKDIQQFRVCLESVKFPKSGQTKNQFNDVILQAHTAGIVLKSASNSGVIMTRCMIRKEFFVEGTYNIDIKNEEDRKRVEEEMQRGGLGKPLIEFCLPISELKQIVDGICEEDNSIQLTYPSGDNYLKVEIPEETKGFADKICQMTVLHLETFEAQHTLDPEFNLNNNQNLAQVFGKVQHFKKALKEFSFLQDKEIVSLSFSDQYPHLQFKYGNSAFNRHHVVKFNSTIDDFVYKKTSNSSALYTIESLRLAFSRITSDNLLCIVTLQNEGYLSVKHMHQDKLLLIESIILAQEENCGAGGMDDAN